MKATIRTFVWVYCFGALLILAGCGSGNPEEERGVQTASISKASVASTTTATPAATAVPTIAAAAVTKISERRINRTVFEYVFQVRFINNGASLLTGVKAKATSSTSSTVVTDGNISVGNLSPGATITPKDTITVRHDRTVPFSLSNVKWTFVSEPVQFKPQLTFYPETLNPLLLSLQPTNGSAVTFFGAKESNGLPQRIEGFYTQPVSSSPPEYTFQLNLQGRISKISMPDGSTLALTWKNESEFVAEIITNNGRVQANVALNLNQSLVQQEKRMRSLTTPAQARVRSGSHTAISSPSKATTVSPLAIVNTNLFVNVNTAGKPESGASVLANIIPANLGPNHPGFNLPLGEISAGEYATTFPNFPSSISPSSIAETCGSILGFIQDVCEINKPLAPYMITAGCVQLAAAVSFAATPAAGAAVLGLCEKAFVASTAACGVVESYVPPETTATCQAISAAVELFDQGGVLVKIKASKDGRAGATSGQVAGNAAEARFSVALPAPPCLIQSLTTSPVQPAAFEFYIATVKTTCGASGGNISLTISGTDGYTDAITCNASDVCQISVPGAEEGVSDVITARTSTGQTRSTALVFR